MYVAFWFVNRSSLFTRLEKQSQSQRDIDKWANYVMNIDREEIDGGAEVRRFEAYIFF